MFIKLSSIDIHNLIRLMEEAGIEKLSDSERITLDKLRLINQAQTMKKQRAEISYSDGSEVERHPGGESGEPDATD